MTTKVGEWALFGAQNLSRIYLGMVGSKHLAVAYGQEEAYKHGNNFSTSQWDDMEETSKIERRYQWRSDEKTGRTLISDYVSDRLAERVGYIRDATTWYKTDKYVEVVLDGL